MNVLITRVIAVYDNIVTGEYLNVAKKRFIYKIIILCIVIIL